jgi:hypothetical protein
MRASTIVEIVWRAVSKLVRLTAKCAIEACGFVSPYPAHAQQPWCIADEVFPQVRTASDSPWGRKTLSSSTDTSADGRFGVLLPETNR